MKTETKHEFELRYLPVQFRMAADPAGANTFEGRVACYNSLSEPLPLKDSEEMFREVIMPGAFTRTLAAGPDVRLLVNHDGLPLARTTSGTLTLSEDAGVGVNCRTNLDLGNPRAQEAQSALKRGDVNQMSFAFRCMDENWRRDEGGQLIRELRDIELHDGDCSIVTYPAYKATSAGIRNLDAANRSYQEFRSKQAPTPVVPTGFMSVNHARRLLALTEL